MPAGRNCGSFIQRKAGLTRINDEPETCIILVSTDGSRLGLTQ